MSTEDDTAATTESPASPGEQSIWTRTRSVTALAGERVVRHDFVTEPGVFFVEVSVDDLGEASTWFDLYRASDGGVAGGILSVNVQENGHVSVGTSHDD